MLNDYLSLSTEALVDLLAQKTQKFTQLIGKGDQSPEYDELKTSIQTIQELIETRKQRIISSPNPGSSPEDIPG